MDHTPPRAPPAKYKTPLGTRWQKEKASAQAGAFEYPEDARFVGPWIIGECVGKGASGHVKIAKHRRTGQLAAVKILPLQPFVNSRNASDAQAKSEKQRLGIDREITMMKLMNHPNIMRIYDVYEGDHQLYLILEYVEGGELFDFLVNRGKLPPLEALSYFKQIVYGLNYAHTFSIIHRDLKPENILIHSLNPPLIKIADWGMAAFAPPSLQLETSCGSPHYASPEIVNGHKYTGTATDIWSCGVILYALLTGRLPFDDKNVRTLLNKVKTGKYEMPAYIDPLAKDLLSRMLVVDVHKRISMSDILAHPWLQGSTPGILYVPAPSVDELARPLPSALHIDRDLFESLCVVWGRHADTDLIKFDLLSPAGHGTLAKAFYFLLLKHREKTMEEHGILMDVDEVLNSPGKVVTKQYAAPRSRPKLRRDIQSAPGSTHVTTAQHQQALRMTPIVSPGVPKSTASQSQPPLRIEIPELPLRPGSHHPPSPVGPRPQKQRPISTPVPPLDNGRHRGPHTAPIPQRGYSESDRSERPRPRSVLRPTSPAFHPHPRYSMRAPGSVPDRSSAASPPGAFRAPDGIPPTPGNSFATMSNAAGPSAQSPLLPMITAPRVRDANLQRMVNHYATVVNNQAANWNAVVNRESVHAPSFVPFVPQSVQSQQQHVQAQPLQDVEMVDVSQNDDKENQTRSRAGNENRRGQVHAQDFARTGGLGFGQSVPMGKDVGNVIYTTNKDSSEKDPVKKEKTRRPTLELTSPSLSHRKTTNFSLIGSPTMMSPPTSIGSPIVGEFKGWFSNLFHWKVQSYLLYSTDDPVATRNETARILEAVGVIVALEDNQAWSTLKCKMEDVYESGLVVQKQLRFRVEISSIASMPPGTTPRISQNQNPMSPTASSFINSAQMKSRVNMEKLVGYETVLAFVLEKGAVSTFKALYSHVKTEWKLDALMSPRSVAGGSGAMGTSSMSAHDHRMMV
ncbi:Pkinase-domain-containing protein [Panus rudis PR-1116 ss-1]|nr:Pkinase-domain-containing protein [Panus rudis PR-1116 ss-1]